MMGVGYTLALLAASMSREDELDALLDAYSAQAAAEADEVLRSQQKQRAPLKKSQREHHARQRGLEQPLGQESK